MRVAVSRAERKKARAKTQAQLHNLAVVPNENVYKSKRLDAIRKGADPYEKAKGRTSYSVKAVQAGVFHKVAGAILSYRKENPTASYMDLYNDVLHERFGYIFDEEEMYSGNVSKIVNSVQEWSDAWFFNQSELVGLAESRLYQLLGKDDIDDKTVISAYDKIKKYEAVNKELDKSSVDNSVIVDAGSLSEWLKDGDDVCTLN
uniref:Uncharacterized protein n=1 Tax=Siphoviridae sp. ct87j35 TaxID=2825356 RepID=A0A8S5V4L8_9CAUD|nr:MAG TPA: hypothetical protein [Siphoviridae sp. ct87j35]